MLNFDEFVSWATNYFGVDKAQIVVSLKKSSATKNFKGAFDNLKWEVEEIVSDVKDYESCCGGKIPKKMIHVNILKGKKTLKRITIYSHLFYENNRIKTSITTSCRKSNVIPAWHILKDNAGKPVYYY